MSSWDWASTQHTLGNAALSHRFLGSVLAGSSEAGFSKLSPTCEHSSALQNSPSLFSDNRGQGEPCRSWRNRRDVSEEARVESCCKTLPGSEIGSSSSCPAKGPQEDGSTAGTQPLQALELEVPNPGAGPFEDWEGECVSVLSSWTVEALCPEYLNIFQISCS